jgi:hypothetical protein
VDILNSTTLKKRSILLMVIPNILIAFQTLSKKCSFLRQKEYNRKLTYQYLMMTIYLDIPRQNCFTDDDFIIKQKN